MLKGIVYKNFRIREEEKLITVYKLFFIFSVGQFKKNIVKNCLDVLVLHWYECVFDYEVLKWRGH